MIYKYKSFNLFWHPLFDRNVDLSDCLSYTSDTSGRYI